MAKQVVWDEAATNDLYEIYNFLLDQSESYADSLLEAIFARVDLIEAFPMLGRVVPEVQIPSIRELVVEQYRVLYFVSSSPQIRVIAVRHSARPLEDFPKF